MAAIAASAVSLYPTDPLSSTWQERGPAGHLLIVKRIKLASVSAGDTVTAAILGFDKLIWASAAGEDGTTVFPMAVDPVNNLLVVGAGALSDTIYLTVCGSPETR